LKYFTLYFPDGKVLHLNYHFGGTALASNYAQMQYIRQNRM